MKGGKRQGAGRPKGSKDPHTLQAEEGRRFVVATIAKNLGPLIQAMVDKALEGDVKAFSELFDRGWGKPLQGIEHSGKDGEPIKIISFRNANE